MSADNISPSPWELDPGNGYQIIDANGRPVVNTWGGTGYMATDEANAHAITATPQLILALKALRRPNGCFSHLCERQHVVECAVATEAYNKATRTEAKPIPCQFCRNDYRNHQSWCPVLNPITRSPSKNSEGDHQT